MISGYARWEAHGWPTLTARSRTARHGAALVLVLAVGVAYLGRFVLFSPSGTIGRGPDVQIFLWGLRWWPYAITHGLDPFTSRVLWPPYGCSVLWTTTVPGLSLLMAPVTLLFGPAASWNLLCLAAPVTAAAAAYLLCWELTCRFWPSIAGGVLFGFSSYELSQSQAHLQLTVTAAIPLFVLLLVRHARGKTSDRRLAICVAALTTAEALVSMEILVTMLLMAAILAGATVATGVVSRARVLSTVRWTLGGLVVTGVLTAPLLIAMLARAPQHPLNPPDQYSADLLNFAIPTRVTALGGAAAVSIAGKFSGNLAEQSAYLGVPLLLILVAYGFARRRTTPRRLLLVMLGIAVLLSLGPVLHIDGHPTIWLPGSLWSHVPFLQDALPGRLTVYVSLIAAVIVALWLSEPSRVPQTRWVLVGLSVIALAPATARNSWWQRTPSAIASGRLAAAIPRGSTVISLPFWQVEDRGLYAQAAAGMDFRLLDQWVQDIPGQDRPFMRDAALYESHIPAPDIPALERALCGAGVQYVIVWNDHHDHTQYLSAAPFAPTVIGDVLLYHLPTCPGRAPAGDPVATASRGTRVD